MVRTQISLTEEQKHRLDVKAAADGVSLSDLIRRAVDDCYPDERDTDSDITAIRQAIGAWQGRDFDGETYVERVRSGRRPAT